MRRILLIFMTIFSFMSCASTQQSTLVKNNIQLNMSKSQVEEKLGKPFKIESKQSESYTRIDSFYYKESLWTGNEYVTIENVLIFENDILVEIKQGEEIVDNPIIIKKNK